MADNGFDWGSFFGNALAGYLGGKGTSGDTPNFYPVPQTPEEKRWDDERWRVYQQGGSPNMQAMSTAARQFLGNMPTTANPQFASPMMKGQAFAGGIQLPKIDLTQIPFGPPQTQAPGPGRGQGGQEPGGPGSGFGPPDDGGDPLNPRGGGGPFGPDPYGKNYGPGGMPTSGDMGFPADTPGEFGTRVANWWAEFRKNNPDWWQKPVSFVMSALGTAFAGPAGAQAASWLKNWIMGNGTGSNTMPLPTGQSLGDVAKNAPGTRDQNGNPPPADPPPYTGYRINPRTGEVERDDPTRSDGQQDADRDFWRGLQTPGLGDGPTSGMPMQPTAPSRRR